MIDVLIIVLVAGLTCALKAKKNKKVLVVSKTYPTYSQSVQAKGNKCSLYEDNDSVTEHIEDTYKASM